LMLCHSTVHVINVVCMYMAAALPGKVSGSSICASVCAVIKQW